MDPKLYYPEFQKLLSGIKTGLQAKKHVSASANFCLNNNDLFNVQTGITTEQLLCVLEADKSFI